MKYETQIVHRDRWYFVIVRPFRAFLGIVLWRDKTWRVLPWKFLSKGEAVRLCKNVKSALRGKYHPKAAFNA